MPNIHTVTLPDGTTAKRTSQNRTYTHAIAIGPQTKLARLDELHRLKIMYEGELTRYERTLAELPTMELVVDDSGFSTRICRPGHTRRDWLALLEKGETLEQVRARITVNYREYVASTTLSLERVTATIAEVEAGPALVGSWRVNGWAGRPDLAAKAEATARSYFGPRGHEVRSIPANLVVK